MTKYPIADGIVEHLVKKTSTLDNLKDTDPESPTYGYTVGQGKLAWRTKDAIDGIENKMHAELEKRFPGKSENEIPAKDMADTANELLREGGITSNPITEQMIKTERAAKGISEPAPSKKTEPEPPKQKTEPPVENPTKDVDVKEADKEPETKSAGGWNVKGFLQASGIIGLATALGAVVVGGGAMAAIAPALLVAAPVVALAAGAMALSNKASEGSAVVPNSPSQVPDGPQKEVNKSGPDIIQNNEKPLDKFATQMMDSKELAANMSARIAPVAGSDTIYEYKSADGKEVIGAVDTSRLYGDKYELVNDAGLVIGYLNAQTFQESLAPTKGNKQSPFEDRGSNLEVALMDKVRGMLEIENGRGENSPNRTQQHANLYDDIRTAVAGIAGEELTRAMEKFATTANGGTSLKNDLIVSSGAGGVKQASHDIVRG